MRKLSSKQLQKIINEEYEALKEAGIVQASPRKSSVPPPVPAVARSSQVKENLGHIKEVMSQLKDLVRAIETGSGDEGMSSYYVAQELDKAAKLLMRPLLFFKKNSAK